MIRCPCGGETVVRESRHLTVTNRTRRRRQCLACGARFSTYEVAAETLMTWPAWKADQLARGRVLRLVPADVSQTEAHS